MPFFKIECDATKDSISIFIEDMHADLSDLFALKRFGVVVRTATMNEERDIEAEEQEQEIGDDDLYYCYPDDLDCITLHIKDF
jgi:hypothetical protein